MIINTENLRTLGIVFNAAFMGGVGRIKPRWQDIAMKVPSSTAEEEYGWLGLFPAVREWLGDRVIQSIAVQRYAIRNKDYESTIAVPRNSIEDDKIGIFTPMFEELGRGAAELPDKLIFALMAAGFATFCYDGQYFFDTDHPVLDEEGQSYSVSNYTYVAPPAVAQGAPANPDYPAWYLFDTTRAIRPLIYQERRPFNFVAKDKGTDDNVFYHKEFVYGTDGRANAGYGFWQLAYAVRGPLNGNTYAAARAAMSALRGDYGHRLGITPNVLVAPVELEGAARAVLKADRDEYGASNVWAGSADMIITPWL